MLGDSVEFLAKNGRIELYMVFWHGLAELAGGRLDAPRSVFSAFPGVASFQCEDMLDFSDTLIASRRDASLGRKWRTLFEYPVRDASFGSLGVSFGIGGDFGLFNGVTS